MGSIGDGYAGGGRGVEIEMMEICLGGSMFCGTAASVSTSAPDVTIGAGAGTCTGSGFISGSNAEPGL